VTALSEVVTCDGYTVEGPTGCLGWVEETWVDAGDRPAAFAIRTVDGRRALVRVDAIQAIDADAQEVFVPAEAALLELEPPRLEGAGGDQVATWRATSSLLTPAAALGHLEPTEPALLGARTSTARRERSLVRTILLALGCLATLVAVEIALAFAIAYLVAGRIT
jgi:hypothetical protein